MVTPDGRADLYTGCMEPAYLDIGPIGGDNLLGSLLLAIGNCAPEIGRVTIITSGGRPLAVLGPVMVSDGGPCYVAPLGFTVHGPGCRHDVGVAPVTWQAEVGASLRDDGRGPG